ncbi:MAG: hypothetical protein FD148_2202 [Methylocystaceae bacterium]|nr:MAG: hypothetical protein FD148_2202 [Methylocystaceae bacterium]
MYRKILLPIDLTETFDSEMRVVKRAVAPAHLFSRLRA